MWDEALVARVKERKTGELMMYAGLIRYDPAKRDVYLDVIDMLGKQLDACDALLAGAENRPEAEKLISPAYRGRLSPSETADEDVFNSYIVHPINPNDAYLSEYILGLMKRAEQVKADTGPSEAMLTLKDELKACRGRIEMLTGQLDFAQEENAALNDQINDLKEQLDSVPAPMKVPDVSWIDDELVPISKLLDEVVDSDSTNPEFYLSRLDEAQGTIKSILDRLSAGLDNPTLDVLNETLGKVYVLKASVDITAMLLKMQNMDETPCGECCPEEAEVPAEPEAEEPETEPEDDGYYERILGDDELKLLATVEAIKNSKIDYFVDMALTGHFNETACDDVVDFLKVDISIIRALLAMDYHSKKSIDDNFHVILDILDNASEPKHQKMYVNSLSAQEKILEDAYNNILAGVQTVMLSRYAGEEE